jgi:hypothetical protein
MILSEYINEQNAGYDFPKEISDTDFISSFEKLTLEPELFTHEAHIRLAWLYLRKFNSFKKALEKISEGIRQFDIEFSSEIKYNHTITVAFAKIVFNRMKQDKFDSWQIFIDSNPDLLQSKTLLLNYYTEEKLYSAHARIKFIEPDKTKF